MFWEAWKKTISWSVPKLKAIFELDCNRNRLEKTLTIAFELRLMRNESFKNVSGSEGYKTCGNTFLIKNWWTLLIEKSCLQNIFKNIINQ